MPICDNCTREFNLDKRHVFKTPDQAMTMAGQHGWNVNYVNRHANCPECMVMPQAKYGVRKILQALSNTSMSYHPRMASMTARNGCKNCLQRS